MLGITQIRTIRRKGEGWEVRVYYDNGGIRKSKAGLSFDEALRWMRVTALQPAPKAC